MRAHWKQILIAPDVSSAVISKTFWNMGSGLGYIWDHLRMRL